MLRKLQALSPPFLNKIDHYLLVNHPAIWATKLHQILFVSVIGLGLLSLKALLTPLSLQDLPNPDTHFGLLMIPTAIIGLIWGIRVYQFKPERSFGRRRAGQWMQEQAIYALAIFMLLSGPIAYSLILNERIDQQIDDQTFGQDVFILNMGSEYYLHEAQYPKFGYYYLDGEHQFATHNHAFSVPAEPHEHSSQIQRLVDTYNRYSTEAYPLSTEILLERFHNEFRYQTHLTEKIGRQVSDNVLILSRIKTDHSLLSSLSSINMLFMMFIFVCLAFAVFQQANWKQFLMALASAAAGGLIIGLASEFLEQGFRYSRQEDWAMLIGTALYGLLLTQIFGNKHSRLLAAWKGVAILVVSLGFPVLLMFFLGWSNMMPDAGELTFTFMLLIVAVVSYAVWNGLYRLRLNAIQASPTKN